MSPRSVGVVQNQIQEKEGQTFDAIESIVGFMEVQRWNFIREGEAIQTNVKGRRADYHACYAWYPDINVMHFSCGFDQKVPAHLRGEVDKLTLLVNPFLVVGHFEYRENGGMIVFRSSMPLFGGEISDAEINHLLKSALDACDAYSPAFQEVIAGIPAAEALDRCTRLFETQGGMQ